MIFSKGLDDKVRDGTKTQTRRLVKGGVCVGLMIDHEIIGVYEWNNRLKWAVGNTYAIQPKRGVKGNGRFRITKIRKERVQDISYEDIGAEGLTELLFIPINTAYLITGAKNEDELKRKLFRSKFAALWDCIHKKRGNRWEDNPLVWVLEIENVGRD